MTFCSRWNNTKYKQNQSSFQVCYEEKISQDNSLSQVDPGRHLLVLDDLGRVVEEHVGGLLGHPDPGQDADQGHRCHVNGVPRNES